MRTLKEYEERYAELDKAEREAERQYYTYKSNLENSVIKYNECVESLEGTLNLPKLDIKNLDTINLAEVQKIYQVVSNSLEELKTELDAMLFEDTAEITEEQVQLIEGFGFDAFN